MILFHRLVGLSQMTLLFKGAFSGESANRSAARWSRVNLDELRRVDPEEFLRLFSEWLVQCWMSDNEVPNDTKSLRSFRLDSVIQQFIARFGSGDWARMEYGQGISPERFVLFLQLMRGIPFAIVFNESFQQEELPPGTTQLRAPMGYLGHALVLTLSQTPVYPILLYDNINAHVINPIEVTPNLAWLKYEDFGWKPGLSMLSSGENTLGISARNFESLTSNKFVVSVYSMLPAIYAIPIPLSWIPQWKKLFRNAENETRARRTS
jgi:hypothetical protein